eukprot:gene29680-38265_t
MLWVKAFHIVFVASWFAGLFYLPRIFVNLAMVAPGSAAERDRLLLMARKLMRFTTLLAVPAIALGLWLWLGYGIGRGSGNGWMHAKLAVVLVVVAQHHPIPEFLHAMLEPLLHEHFLGDIRSMQSLLLAVAMAMCLNADPTAT